jgi:cation diffusion facilitator family transporter
VAGSGGAKAVVAAFFGNLGIAIAKLIGWGITGSSSMLAESVHSLADTGNQGLLLWGRRAGKKAADKERPFGYGRERFFWAFVVSIVLFSLGSLFAIWEGFHKIQHPEAIKSPQVALAILAIAVVFETIALRLAYQESRKLAGRRSLWRFIRTTKIPELPVVLLEDSGALAGLAVAFTALMLAWHVDPIWDGIGTVIIGVLLGIIATVLAIETRSLLLGEAASEDDIAEIRAAILDDDATVRLIHMRTEHIGPERILVGAKVEFARGLDIAQVASAIDRCEADIRKRVPIVELIYLEPDVYSEDRVSD